MTAIQTNVQAPASLPLLRLQGETINPTWRDNAVIQDALMEVDEFEGDTEEDIDQRKRDVIEHFINQVEEFITELDATEGDSIGDRYDHTTYSVTGIKNFAAQNVGITLGQLIDGVRFMNGRVFCDTERFIDDACEELQSDLDEEIILAQRNQYQLQADGTFKLVK